MFGKGSNGFMERGHKIVDPDVQQCKNGEGGSSYVLRETSSIALSQYLIHIHYAPCNELNRQ